RVPRAVMVEPASRAIRPPRAGARRRQTRRAEERVSRGDTPTRPDAGWRLRSPAKVGGLVKRALASPTSSRRRPVLQRALLSEGRHVMESETRQEEAVMHLERLREWCAANGRGNLFDGKTARELAVVEKIAALAWALDNAAPALPAQSSIKTATYDVGF